MDGDHENIPLQDLARRNQKYRSIFEQCDTNRDGFICFRELYDFLNFNQSSRRFLKKKAVRRIAKAADSDGDRLLDFDEFIEILERQDLQDLLGGYVSRYVRALVPHPKTPADHVDRVHQLQLRSFGSEEDDEEEKDLCTQYTCCPPPIFMFLISMLQFALFIADEMTKDESYSISSGVTAKVLQYDPRYRSEFWRYVTYMFVHMGYLHIIANLIFQLGFGIALEMVNESWRVLLIYFLGGIAGCLAHGIIDSNAILGGASGGVFALMTAHLAQVFLNLGHLPISITCIQLLIISLLVFPELAQSAYHRYYLQQITEAGVTCHLGGAFAGFLVGIYIIRNVNISQTEKYIWWVALVIFILLMATGIALNVLHVTV
ncbi:unnamed protein product [Phaedon cochleariae]|uniref:EF-hand domain-containing protein n=1 Tax=Phaedon cochleariae TaxID=80249 RepID=A0A9P0DF30_PHACE|nr:unnamed protein product [Phaedon cochleariae]